MGMNIFDSIGISTDVVVIALIIIVILQFAWIFAILAKCNKLNKRISRFTTGHDAANLEEIMAKRFSEMRQIVKNEK